MLKYNVINLKKLKKQNTEVKRHCMPIAQACLRNLHGKTWEAFICHSVFLHFMSLYLVAIFLKYQHSNSIFHSNPFTRKIKMFQENGSVSATGMSFSKALVIYEDTFL